MNQNWRSDELNPDDGSLDTPTIVSFADLLENQLNEPELAAFVKFLGQVEEHPDGKGMIDIVASLVSLCFIGKANFISNAKQSMRVEESAKYDRFLNYIWENYLKNLFQSGTVVLDNDNVKTKMHVYATVMQDIRKLALLRNYETWPHVLKEGELLEDF